MSHTGDLVLDASESLPHHGTMANDVEFEDWLKRANDLDNLRFLIAYGDNLARHSIHEWLKLESSYCRQRAINALREEDGIK